MNGKENVTNLEISKLKKIVYIQDDDPLNNKINCIINTKGQFKYSISVLKQN